jgi:putative ABC transport system substrate-binding protein
MKRRTLLTAVGVFAAGPARAQRLPRPVRVGYLSPNAADDPLLAQLHAGFGQLGWIEGRDYVLHVRFASLQAARLAALFAELRREGIDVLVTVGAATRILPEAERSVPVVFSFSGDPIAAGYVKSLARPAGNATGNSQMMWELVGKRIELLREIAPAAKRALVVQSPDHPGEIEERRLTMRAGEQVGLEVVVRSVHDRATLEAALAGSDAANCDSLLCFTDSVTIANRHLIAEHARRARIPSVAPRREFVDAGGLASYGPSIPALTARLAYFVKRIADGVRPGDIPVEWPTVIETVVNLKTAKAIGVTVPTSALLRADEVIE